MVVGPDLARRPRPEEHDEIDALLRAAFGRAAEAELVRRLRADGDMWWEAVKPWAGVIGAYAALSRMREPEGWACLAPLAVLPRFQNGASGPWSEASSGAWRLGSRLASEVADLTTLSGSFEDRRRMPAAIVVLGSVPFYERAGFSAARAANLRSPHPIGSTLLAAPGDDAPEATLVYPSAFDAP